MAAKIKKGDTVIVIAGRDKGRTGEVIEVRRDDGRALVRGVNMVKRHQRQTRRMRAASSPKRRRSTCRISRWPIRRTKSRRASASRFIGKGDDRKKVRVAKRSGAEIDG